ncbi:hypothetical protein SKAU_G00254390 [Synaphobranchus kaupii]|uniref:Lactate/malate dehydrogenase C-terminal domain-containing protein n=1 Tax=Synaphobranchus kaupii TaxID=118154 RepID=A0A9Q1F3H3_SYNKA|nr:hypothetical protein SKAU_G00254390 [Synaphobranchus kaupii]
MAKFVLAGKADCPYFAKAEILADFLQRNLPNFSIHKIRQQPKDWQRWLEDTCGQNGWKHEASPIVWRELIDRGGRGLLLGGFSDFLEHVQGYYGITPDMSTALMLEIATENQQAVELCRKEEKHHRSLIQPKHIWISSSLNLTCYHLIPLLCDPEVLCDIPALWLHLLDVDGSIAALEGLRMEAEDLACPRIHQVSVHTCLDHAFLHAHVVVFLDELNPDQEEDEERTLLRKTVEHFQCYGQLMEAEACKDVRVIVAGNSFINLKVSVLLENAPSLDSSHFVGIATQLESEARAQIAQKLKVKSADVRDVIVWGNISGSFHIDLQRSKVLQFESAVWGPPGFSLPVPEMIFDQKWLESDFLNFVGSQRTTVTSKTQRTAALSAANGIAAVLKAWDSDSTPGELCSLGVLSTGQFGIPAGLVFSMPVSFQGGSWSALPDITISEELQSNLQAAANQLRAEKGIASGVLSGQS